MLSLADVKDEVLVDALADTLTEMKAETFSEQWLM